MRKKSDDFSDISVQRAMQLAQSEAGQQLYQLLQRTQGQQLQSMMDQAAAGNFEEIKKNMQSLLASPQARELLSKMQE